MGGSGLVIVSRTGVDVDLSVKGVIQFVIVHRDSHGRIVAGQEWRRPANRPLVPGIPDQISAAKQRGEAEVLLTEEPLQAGKQNRLRL